MRQLLLVVMTALLTPLAVQSQKPDWAAAQQETIAHLQASHQWLTEAVAVSKSFSGAATD